MKYVQRVSYILRQGVPVADIAVLLPEEDHMAESSAGNYNAGQKVAIKPRFAKPGEKLPQFGLETALGNRSSFVSSIVTNGYAFDGLNVDGLQKARIQGGRLKVGLGDYGILLLPAIKGLPVESMEKIRAFAAAGGKVIAVESAPTMSYGLSGWRANGERVRQLAAEVFGRLGGSIAPGDGPPLVSALRACHPPDIDFQPADPEIGFVHRHKPPYDFYFLANTSAQAKDLVACFRVGRRAPELWDPISGRAEPPVRFEYRTNGTGLTLHLEGYQSIIVRFAASRTPPPAAASTSKPLPAPVPVAGPWQLEVNGEVIPLTTLGSWTAHERLRYFSGTGTYRTTFRLPESFLASSLRLQLEMGSVREIAEVEVNGKAAGVAWMQPYRLDVTPHAAAGENQLTIRVTNLLINKVLGDPKPDTRALVQKFGARFAQANARPDLKFDQNYEKDALKGPLPSGLLGPVLIQPFRR